MTSRSAYRGAPWSFAAPWGGRGYISDLDGPVHWIEFGTGPGAGAGTGTAPPIVFVHGLGGSHLNWALIGPALADARRAIALDLGGFGLTPGSGRATTVRANAGLVDRFVTEIVQEPAILVGNSMGGMISVIQAAAQPGNVAGLVLVDPSLPVPLQRPDLQVAGQFLLFSIPGVGKQFIRMTQSRLTSAELVDRVIRLCFADPGRADPQVIQAGIALADERRSIPAKEASFVQAARSLMSTLARPAEYRAMLGGIGVPVLLIHGESDRLVPVAAARQAARQRPAWDTVFLPGVGHTPQLEVPGLVADAICDWLGRYPSLATGLGS